MIRISTTAYPKKEVYAVCDVCNKEVARETYDTYFDHSRVQSKLRKKHKICPFCEAAAKAALNGAVRTPKWQKHVDIYGRVTRNWEAKLPDGDFYVWRQGKLWKARWRVYGSDEPIMLGFASTLDGIKKRCEHSKYWTVK